MGIRNPNPEEDLDPRYGYVCQLLLNACYAVLLVYLLDNDVKIVTKPLAWGSSSEGLLHAISSAGILEYEFSLYVVCASCDFPPN